MENTPQIILGEANYKKWVNSVDPDNMLNRQVSDLLVYMCRVEVCFKECERILFCWIIPNDSEELHAAGTCGQVRCGDLLKKLW